MSTTIAPLWDDYLMQFPVSGLTQDLAFLAAVRAAGFMGGPGALPDNMLGDKRNADGSLYVSLSADPAKPGTADTHAFCGRPGTAAFSYPATDPSTGLPTGATVNVPAAGDPTVMYLAIRSPISQAKSAALQTSLGLNPATYGITPSDPTVSAAVLGVWA